MEEIGKIYGISKAAVLKRLKKLHERLRGSAATGVGEFRGGFMADLEQRAVQLRAKQHFKSVPPVCPATASCAPSGHIDG